MINPCDYPICFQMPDRLAVSPWTGHIPFGMLLVDLLKPQLIVELGTHRGVSYCAFCQAVQKIGLGSRCYAIDTWLGDEHSGRSAPGVIEELRAYHDARYAAFSTLIRSSFDEACATWPAATIDVLHIDGFHTYEAVKHDLEHWLPKMTASGVVLLHDITERQGDFGVWRLWQELSCRYPHFEFNHSHGLGIIAVGSTPPPGFLEFAGLGETERDRVRQCFAYLGSRCVEFLDRQTLLVRMRQVARAVEQRLNAQGDALQPLQASINKLSEMQRELTSALLSADNILTTIEDGAMK